jgi:hypothetical protein
MKALKLRNQRDELEFSVYDKTILVHITDSLNNHTTNGYELPDRQISKIITWLMKAREEE